MALIKPVSHLHTTLNQLHAYISLGALFVILLWIRSRRAKRQLPLPPSLKPDPLIGNMRAMVNIVDEPRAYRDWGLELGSKWSCCDQRVLLAEAKKAISYPLVFRDR